MKMKKILFSVFMFAFVAVMSLVLVEAAAGDADKGAQELLTSYYNNGVYTKQTVINVKDSTSTEVKAYFHANANELERTTYYNGGELWMTNAAGTINSGYGTGEGYTTHFKKVEGVNKIDYTVKGIKDGRDWTSMETAFITLFDLKQSTGWDKSGTVYVNKTATVLDQFREFVAPMWLSGEETSNYVVFEKATMENTKDGLVLKLYVESTDSSKLISGVNLVFAQALIVDHLCQYSELGHDATHHYDVCTCGAIDNTSKVAHSGGTATTTEKAVCTVCGVSYGELKKVVKVYFEMTWDNITEVWCNDVQMVKDSKTGYYLATFETALTKLDIDFKQGNTWWHIKNSSDIWNTNSSIAVNFALGKSYLVKNVNWTHEYNDGTNKWYSCTFAEYN